jgi:nicotinate-nucleotide pyrophosphorylase (carboxylating)
MLDNFAPEDLKTTALELKSAHPHVIVEGSGGITEETIGSFMGPGVDVLSTSSIHQGVPHVDFSLKIKH